jgi:hypothetical protein
VPVIKPPANATEHSNPSMYTMFFILIFSGGECGIRTHDTN